MKKTFSVLAVAALLAAMGCGGGTDEAAGASVVMEVQMSTQPQGSINNKAVIDDDPTSDTNMGNPNLTDVKVDPVNYSVALIKVEVGTVPDTDASMEDMAQNFAPSFTIYEQASPDAAELFDITTSADVSNTTGCSAGTFNTFRSQLLFLQMEFDADVGDGLTQYTFRDYTSSYSGTGDFGASTIEDGDVMINDGGTYKWINSETGAFDTTRPSTPVQDAYFSGAYEPHSTDPQYAEIGGVYVFQPVVVIEPPLVISSCTSGTYTYTATFDVSDTFFFDDCDDDGNFEPGSGDAPDSAACGAEIPQWYPGPPVMSATSSE